MANPHKWLIWSIEHNAYWRPAWGGYTQKKSEAGRYSFIEAIKIVAGANKYMKGIPNEAMILDEEGENV